MTNALSAANSYAAIARLAQQQQNKPADQGATNTLVGDFASMVSSGVNDVVAQGKVADTQTMNLANGKANMVDVVTAVAETEVALETMVTLRDRVISAYEEILRMPI